MEAKSATSSSLHTSAASRYHSAALLAHVLASWYTHNGSCGTLDSAAVQLEETMQAASRTTSRMEEAVSVENLAAINAILADMRLIQADIATIVSTSISTSDNLQSITEAGEDRINGLLQRMEAAAINVEEMTGRLRDDPSLIIRGSE